MANYGILQPRYEQVTLLNYTATFVNGNADPYSYSFWSGVGPGRFLVVGSKTGDVVLNSVTYGGLLVPLYYDAYPVRLWVLSLPDSIQGSQTLSFDYSAYGSNYLSVAAYGNVDCCNPIDFVSYSATTSTTPGTPRLPIQRKGAIHAFLGCGYDPGSGNPIISSGTSLGAYRSAGAGQGAAAAYSTSVERLAWTAASHPWQLIAIGLRPRRSTPRLAFYRVAAGASHATSGALVGPGSVVAGTAAHHHKATGALVGAGSTVAGTATHKTLHTTTGALVGAGSVVAGTAAHQHAATGALVGAGSTVAGTAAHKTLHTTTGALVGAGSTIAGTAAHQHAATGALVGAGSVVAGTAAHQHAATGALVGAGAVVVGTAVHTAPGVHATSGALVGPGSTVAGTAAHHHKATGALVGAGATIAGTAAHKTLHTTTGALVGSGAAVVGAADHAAPAVHATSGALVGPGASISGTATRLALHTTSGILVGSGAVVSGTATRLALHTTSGALVGQGAVIDGEAAGRLIVYAALTAAGKARNAKYVNRRRNNAQSLKRTNT